MSGIEPREVVVCITPFARDGSLDLELVESHLRRIMSSVRHVLVGGSGTEEGFALTREERRAVVDTAVRLGAELGSEVRLNAVEPRTPGLAIADVRLARDAGVDAVHVPILDVGHGYRPRPDELLDYLRVVLAEAGDLDVYISSSTAMGNVYPVDVLCRVAEHPSTKGAVVGAPSELYLGEVIRNLPDWDIYVAGTPQLANGLILGARGFVSPEGNIAPQVSRAVATAAAEHDWISLRSGIETLMRITAAVIPWGLSSGLKAALRGLGLLDSTVRTPRIDVAREAEAAITTEVANALERWSATAGPTPKEN